MSAPAVPRPAATVMLLRDGADDRLEVLLLRRSSRMEFVPGAHVFPGGAVDQRDHRLDAAVLAGLDDESAAAILRTGEPGSALASWVAAVRECFEEVGVLLARTAEGNQVPPDHSVFADAAATRDAVEAGAIDFLDLLRDHQLHVRLDRLAYVSHWITPPVSPRRYDTRFFAVAMPAGQATSADGREAVELGWWSPATALADWQAGSIDLIEPTVANLRVLARFERARDALEQLHAAAGHPDRIQEPGGGERTALAHERPAATSGGER